MTLLDARAQCRLTQAQAAAHLGVSLRSYKSYETDPAKAATMKYRYLTEQLESLCRIDEDHGILTVDEIRAACTSVLRDYAITYGYNYNRMDIVWASVIAIVAIVTTVQAIGALIAKKSTH